MVVRPSPGSSRLTPPSPVDGERTDFWHTVQISRCGTGQAPPEPAPTGEHTSTSGGVNRTQDAWSGRDPDHPALSDLHYFPSQGSAVHDRLGIFDGPAVDLDPALLDQPAGLRVGRGQPDPRQKMRDGDLPVLEGGVRDRHLLDVLGDLVALEHLVEPGLGLLPRSRAVVQV